MGCRGVHFALTEDESKQVLDTVGDDDALVEIIHEEIEERWDKDWLAESDKAWDAIHRCLTDGRLDSESTTPMHWCILGGQQLYEGDDYIISYVAPPQVTQVSKAIADITENWMRERYNLIPEADYGLPLSDEDFEYTWSWFQGVRDLFQKASAANRAVMFSVDQ